MEVSNSKKTLASFIFILFFTLMSGNAIFAQAKVRLRILPNSAGTENIS